MGGGDEFLSLRGSGLGVRVIDRSNFPKPYYGSGYREFLPRRLPLALVSPLKLSAHLRRYISTSWNVGERSPLRLQASSVMASGEKGTVALRVLLSVRTQLLRRDLNQQPSHSLVRHAGLTVHEISTTFTVTGVECLLRKLSSPYLHAAWITDRTLEGGSKGKTPRVLEPTSFSNIIRLIYTAGRPGQMFLSKVRLDKDSSHIVAVEIRLSMV
ncbi:hypothetical protein ARMGADRAFT_1146716 [Armillaria gallica]|uniref:Uncharacterized protein n=1 Tax=Armillaria gallica TaxID=47427 RepID=A0A2H3CDE6_ARMGA|nr:hypothetical protein ARMGADRAFT_1146716 [Armillaria gallica]